MIVKDECSVIERCLESVRPLVSTWVIVDTGSSDGTQDVIRKYFKDIPGELHERPWVNFGHNRNEALDLARGKADYILFIDADETFAYAPDFKKPELTKDFYYIMSNFSGTHYKRVHLVKDGLNWKWIGAVHEAVDSPLAKTSDTLHGVTNVVGTDGNRAKDPARFLRDAELLEKELEKDPTNRRNMFYLAQSYKDAQVFDKSVEAYQRRISMGGWEEEIYWSLLQIAKMEEQLGASLEQLVERYKKAYQYRPIRSETLYYLANLYRRKGDYKSGYETAAIGLKLKPNSDILFVEQWVNTYGLLLEFSICAYWIEKYWESFLASQLILAQNNLPDNIRECVNRNLTWIDQKLNENQELFHMSRFSNE